MFASDKRRADSQILQLILVISNTDISEYRLISKNIVQTFPIILHISCPNVFNYCCLKCKFSGEIYFEISVVLYELPDIES